MRKWLKRLFAFSILLAMGALLMAIQFHRAPAWYHPQLLSGAQLRAAANRADQSLAEMLSWAADARAAETRARLSNESVMTSAPSRPNEKSITFSQVELNAFFNKWGELHHWSDFYEPYLHDPMVILQDGRLILAAQVEELGSVVSLHFAPTIDADGNLRLPLERVLSGRLPLPHSVMDRPMEKLRDKVKEHLPSAQRAAKIDRSGATNTAAISATMSKLFLEMCDDRPAEPVLFLPIDGNRGVPVRLTSIKIEDETLTMIVEPLTPGEREQLLAHIKAPIKTSPAKSAP